MRFTVRTLAAAAALAAAAPFARAQTTPTTPAPTTSGGSGMAQGAMQDSTGAMRGGAMRGTSRRGGVGRTGATDSTLVAQLDSVNTAAKAGLTNLPVSVAGPLLESLQGKLSASGNAALRSIASDLGALRTALTGSTVDGAQVGAILRRVGPKVTRVASTQSGAVRATLREIGGELSAAGKQLAGGA